MTTELSQNTKISVTLTMSGVRILNEHQEFKNRYAIGDTLVLPFWRLMNIFGAELNPGRSSPFQGERMTVSHP